MRSPGSMRNILAMAAVASLAMPPVSAEVMPRRESTSGAFGARDPYKGPHKMAGSKLWRKASEGKLGLRW